MRFLRSRKVFKQDDAAVLEAYRNTSDSLYLGILFDRYSHLVFAVSMKYLKNEEDSKDAVLQVFEKLSVDLKKYRINEFSHWIHTVTKNHCLRLLKKRSFDVQLDETQAYFAPEEKSDEDKLTDHLLKYLDEALADLNDEQQTCVKLFYLNERSYKEIEEMTGYPYEKVKSYIQNGKRNMKIFLLKKKLTAAAGIGTFIQLPVTLTVMSWFAITITS